MAIPRRIPVAEGDESARLSTRLLSSLPAATFEMETLCRLAGIVSSREIPTAAVECLYRPRLLLNPDFVAKYCLRDEHLFLLVMHELWHILLAHTSVYPKMTPARNIAFDAIINAGLMRQFNKPEYMGFFDVLNPPDKFPHLLLRPPVGWPKNPHYPDDVGPPGTQRVLKQLYRPPPGLPLPMPFYEEILDLMRQDARERGATGGVCLIDGEPVLLGDHENPIGEKGIMVNQQLNDAIKGMAEKWPARPFGIRSRGIGGAADNRRSEISPSDERARRVFAGVLRRCLGPLHGSHRRRVRMPIPGIAGTSVLPNGRDRLSPARRMLGAPSTLWAQPGVVMARVPDKPSKAHVYLDVSGSMSRLIPHLLSLVMPYVSRREAEVFQFSTIVEHLPLAKLHEGRLRTTGGTNINCVLKHALDSRPSVQRLLVVTDGYTGLPVQELERTFNERNMRMHVILPAVSSSEEDLRDIAASVTILPPVQGRRFGRRL